MSNMEINLYPVYVNSEEADERCIQEGWYVVGGESFAANRHTGNPFGSEKEAIEYIENGDSDGLHTSD